MSDSNESDKPDPVICKFCEKEIAEGDMFIELKKNLGVKETTGKYTGVTSLYWDTGTEYVHLRHILFTKKGM